MCDISGISAGDLDWEDAINGKDVSIAELNGRKYKMTILEEDATFAGAIYKHEPHGYTLRNRTVTNGEIPPTKIGGSAELRFEFDYGDKDGPKYSSSARGEVHDEKGNYVRGEATRDQEGKGKVAVAAGHKEDEK